MKNNEKNIARVCGVLIVIAYFLPWMSMVFVSISGFTIGKMAITKIAEGAGPLWALPSLLFVVLGIASAVVNNKRGHRASGGYVLLIVIWILVEMAGGTRGSFFEVIGIGLWITLVAAIGQIVFAEEAAKELVEPSIPDSGAEKPIQPLSPPPNKPEPITSQQGATTSKPSCTAADSALLDAAKSDNTDILKQHLDAGANVNASGKTLLGYSVTPLHEAASWGQKGNIELLIANGANVNAKDETGKTPLDSVTSELTDLLRKHGGKTGEELKAEGK
jgi:hypothetical protein